MKATLKSVTPLENVVDAIRQCWDSGERKDSIYLNNEFILGAHDKALIERVIEAGHTSTLEHLVYTFHIQDLPRFVLQELARHRMASLSVKSSRYTLKELKSEEPFWYYDTSEMCDHFFTERASKYIYLSGIVKLDEAAILALEEVRAAIHDGLPNDVVKQILPECYLCDLYMSINARSAMNLLDLRTSHRALKQFQILAHAMFEQIPEQQKFIFSRVVKQMQ